MDELLLTEAEQQAIEEGEAAASLLDDPAFLLAIDRIRKECAEAILTSNPTDGAKREDLYNLSRGLSAVTVELTNMVSLGVSIRENATLTPTDDDEVQDDPDFDDTSY